MIDIQKISKSYRGVPLFSDWSAQFSDGEHYSITGPSGCGKTTLLRMIAGLDRPDKGTIFVSSGTVFSWMFQENRLIEQKNAVENLMFVSPQLSYEQCREHLLKLALPEDSLKVPVKSFSGGMKRRVALARAVSYSGNVLLLDEPLKGLDAGNQKKAIDYLKKYASGRTVLMITHEVELPEGFQPVRLGADA